MEKHVRLGYHRVSDDSVNSASLTPDEAKRRIAEMIMDVDIDRMWLRNEVDEVIWTHSK